KMRGCQVLLAVFLAGALIGWPASARTRDAPDAAVAAQGPARAHAPQWPQQAAAPQGAPDVVLILLADIGFAHTSTFGGLAQTPELDPLAASGLRFNNLNNTAMCSPTRAALLTRRNHHRVGFGVIADLAGAYPGYNSVWKSSTASIAEVLREN